MVTELIAEVLLLFFICNPVCNGLKAKRNGHFTFEPVIDDWGICLDENINSGAILSFDAVCMGSPVKIRLQKVNK